MNAIKSIKNVIPVRAVTILIVSMCVAILLSCSSGDVASPDVNISGGGFKNRDLDFTAKKTFEDNVLVENQISLNVVAINGEVVVSGQSEADSVMITAQLIVRSDSQEDADLHLDDLDILVTDGPHEILIQTAQPLILNGRQYVVEYDIIVPSGFEVVSSQANGSVAILDIQNRVEVSSKNGDVVLSGIVGGVAANVENGRIDGSVVLPTNETIDLAVDNGDLELSIPTSTSAEFSASVAGVGEIIVSNLDFTDSLPTSHSLTGTLGNGEGSIVLSTVNGKIEIIGFD